MFDFDWLGYIPEPLPVSSRNFITVIDGIDETRSERCMRMLGQLSMFCSSCSMCSYGHAPAVKDHVERDPHVFSNRSYSNFVVVGQNPGWDELKARVPFVGAAGKIFDAEISKYGVERDFFYITNIVKCWTKNNTKPEYKSVSYCQHILMMELQIIQPTLIITLGASAFDFLCPHHKYSDSLGKIIRDDVVEWPIFAVYHPSPRNLSNKLRRCAFEHQIKLLCGMINRLRH